MSAEKSDPDANVPVVEIRVQDAAGKPMDAPSRSSDPLRFVFGVAGTAVELSALVIGPIRPGEDELTLIGIERNFVVLGVEPTNAPVGGAAFAALSASPTDNDVLNQFIESVDAGSYRIVLRGVAADGRVASDVHEWVFEP